MALGRSFRLCVSASHLLKYIMCKEKHVEECELLRYDGNMAHIMT